MRGGDHLKKEQTPWSFLLPTILATIAIATFLTNPSLATLWKKLTPWQRIASVLGLLLVVMCIVAYRYHKKLKSVQEENDKLTKEKESLVRNRDGLIQAKAEVMDRNQFLAHENQVLSNSNRSLQVAMLIQKFDSAMPLIASANNTGDQKIVTEKDIYGGEI